MDWYTLGRQQTAHTLSALEIRRRFDRLVWESENAAEFQDLEATNAFLELTNTPEAELGNELFEKRDLYARWQQSLQSEAQMFEDFARGWLENNPLKIWEVALPPSNTLKWSEYSYSDTYTEISASFHQEVTEGVLHIILIDTGKGVLPDGRREIILGHAFLRLREGGSVEIDCYDFPQLKLGTPTKGD